MAMTDALQLEYNFIAQKVIIRLAKNIFQKLAKY